MALLLKCEEAARKEQEEKEMPEREEVETKLKKDEMREPARARGEERE